MAPRSCRFCAVSSIADLHTELLRHRCITPSGGLEDACSWLLAVTCQDSVHIEVCRGVGGILQRARSSDSGAVGLRGLGFKLPGSSRTLPHPPELLCFSSEPHTHLGVTTSGPRAGGWGGRQKGCGLPSAPSLLLWAVAQVSALGLRCPDVCCTPREAEQGRDGVEEAGSGSSSPSSPWGGS